MDARKVGPLVIGAACIGLLGIGGLPEVAAQEVYLQVPVGSAKRVVTVQDIQGVETGGLTRSPSLAPGGGLLVAIPQEDVVEAEGGLWAVVWPEPRLSFEQLRRILPYGTEHNLVPRFLTADPTHPTQDD